MSSRSHLGRGLSGRSGGGGSAGLKTTGSKVELAKTIKERKNQVKTTGHLATHSVEIETGTCQSSST